MRYSTQVKSISWLKTNAAEALQRLADEREPLLITQNGEAKAVLMDVVSYEQQQETLALLKLLAMGERDVQEGRVTSVDEAFDRVLTRKRAATTKSAA
ncbi:MAG: type II toxin-antitoxin system Phd/YefM family antitoxin [Aquabacterium sp.]|nr:type II toxin-antitoxin system Phd/YefM family antitoxin [Aquabacterium sp.]